MTTEARVNTGTITRRERGHFHADSTLYPDYLQGHYRELPYFESARELVNKIPSGAKVWLSAAQLWPGDIIIDPLIDRCREEPDFNCEINHMSTKSINPNSGYHMRLPDNIRDHTAFLDEQTRNPFNEQNGHNGVDYSALDLLSLGMRARSGRDRYDLVIAQTPLPFADGHISYGYSAEVTADVVAAGTPVLVISNPAIPQTFGDKIPREQVKGIYALPEGVGLPEVTSKELSEVHKRIGENVTSLIKSGSTIQLGIGAVSEAVGFFVAKKFAGLGEIGEGVNMFGELGPPALGLMTELGAINVLSYDEKTGVYIPHMVVTFLQMPSQYWHLFHRNKNLLVMPTSYTNNPSIIAEHGVISVNTAMKVDSEGNTYAHEIDQKGNGTGRKISGFGGAGNYGQGATWSFNSGGDGKAVVALPSSRINPETGELESNIVIRPNKGAVPTNQGQNVTHVVTEYGIAPIGEIDRRDTRKTWASLISIAHPQLQAKLAEEADQIPYLRDELMNQSLRS